MAGCNARRRMQGEAVNVHTLLTSTIGGGRWTVNLFGRFTRG